jgi:hypothetical protein
LHRKPIAGLYSTPIETKIPNGENTAMILADAHVHIYDRFDLNLFFASALRNFTQGAASLGINDFTPVLLLADWSNLNWFERLRQFCLNRAEIPNAVSGLTFEVHQTSEKAALRVSLNAGQSLYIISGKKIITDENLEVLALCATRLFSDGQSLHDTVHSIVEGGAIPVIPWAVGKWLGQRGKVLDDLLEQSGDLKFYLCDNGNRPVFWRWSSHFRKAAHMGIPIISGSDPLHFSSEARRIGRFGFAIEAQLRPQSPASDMLRALSSFAIEPMRYGRLESIGPFLKNQIRMQIFKKKWRKALLK